MFTVIKQLNQSKFEAKAYDLSQARENARKPSHVVLAVHMIGQEAGIFLLIS